MKKTVSLFLACIFCFFLAACGGRSGEERLEDLNAKLPEGMIWVTKTREVYPLEPGCTVTGVARLGGRLLICGEAKDSAPVLALADYTVESDGGVSIGDAVPLSLDEPDAVDEGCLYGVCAGGDGAFYVLTGERPAAYTDSDGAWVENEDYAGRYSILKYSEGGEWIDRMKITGWHGDCVEGIAVGEGGEIVLYGDTDLSLLRWNGDVIRTEELGEGSAVQSVSWCGQGLVASLFEYGTTRGGFYRIDSAGGTLSPLSAVCQEDELALYDGNWSITQGLSGEYVASDGRSFFALDFDAEACTKLFTLDNQSAGSEFPYVCRLSENTFVYTSAGREGLGVASRVAQEYKDRSVVKVAVFHSYAGSQYKAQLEVLNAADGDYIYECTLYEENQIDRLKADLSSQNAPDLVLFDCLGGLDTNSQYFDDLYSYIDSDPDLSRDSFLPNLLDALSFKGRLTQLWEYVQISTMVARTSDVGDGEGLTPADYNRILREHEEYKSMFLGIYGDDREILLSNVATLALSLYTDKDHASCSFDSESFAELLQWVKDAGSQFEEYDSSISYPENFQKVVANFDSLIPIRAQFIAESLFGEPVTYAGYPVGDACGHLYVPDGNRLAMAIPMFGSNKEGAWAFIRDQLSFETQYNAQTRAYEESPVRPRIPVNYEAMKRLVFFMLAEEEAEQIMDLADNTKIAATYTGYYRLCRHGLPGGRQVPGGDRQPDSEPRQRVHGGEIRIKGHGEVSCHCKAGDGSLFRAEGPKVREVCLVVQQEARKRTVWLNDAEQIVSFHFVDGYRQEELICLDDAFIRFLQSLQEQGYRFQ